MTIILRTIAGAMCLLLLSMPALAQSQPEKIAKAQGTQMKQVDAQKIAHTLSVGTRGFAAFQKGLNQGAWDDFLALLTDDFSFFFPQGKYQGFHQGKDKAREFFAYVKTAFPTGLTVTEILHVTAGEKNIVFEFKDEGFLRDAPYKNRVAISWDILGDKISGYREYFGSDGKSN